MSANNSALAHITASYTDSENEDDNLATDAGGPNIGSPSTESSVDSQVIFPIQQMQSPIQTPDKPKKSSNSSLRLVSYHDDTIVSDDDDDNNNMSPENYIVRNINEQQIIEHEIEQQTNTIESTNMLTDEHYHNKYAHYGFTLPPEPKNYKPSIELTEKIKHLYEKMNSNNRDMNQIIQERKEFRNPSIYEKLIQFCDINEFGTNYPPEMYDPLQWGPESFYEEIAKSQKTEMLKRQKERKDTDKVEQATAAARKVEEEAKKRKSKWDQPAPSSNAAAASAKSAAVALTANVTGTKGTVISAFGSLPKKTTI